MYPPVRQFESSQRHFRRVLNRLERAERAPRGRRSRWVAALIVTTVVGAAVYASVANAARAGTAGATVTFGGKTFRFSNGECTTSTGLTVNIGTPVLGSTTTRARPYFGLFLTSARAGTYSGKQAAVSFASGALRVSLAPNATSRVVLDRSRRSGSFSGRDLLGRRFAGSFRC